jgi:glycine betaine/choline ABC-type transport system substrate-binding protein
MLFDFMGQVMSRLESTEKKVEANQQILDKLMRKIEKRKVLSIMWNISFNNF